MTDTLPSLLAACEADPANFTLLLVTADALQDAGQHWLGKAYRWCGASRKHPLCDSYHTHRWFWTTEAMPRDTRVTEFDVSRLPAAWLTDMTWYKTFAEAMQLVADTLESLHSSQENSAGARPTAAVSG